MKKRLILLIALFTISQNLVFSQYECDTELSIPDYSSSNSCPDFENMTYQEWNSMPTAEIFVDFHFIANLNENNFNCGSGGPQNLNAELMVSQMLNQLNNIDLVAHPQDLSGGGSYQLPSYKYKFVPVNGSLTCGSNIFFYDRNGSTSFDAENNINTTNSAVHVIFVDKQSSNGNFSAGGNARIFNGEHFAIIRNAHFLQGIDFGSWNFARTMHHEILHNFGLCHSHYCNNNCANIDLNPINECVEGCLNICGSGECNGQGNNVMGYSGSQTALTSCQLGEIWSFFHNDDPDFIKIECQQNNGEILVVDNNLKWESTRYIDSDIRITEYGHLTINCDVFISSNHTIFVDPGGKLTIDGGKITNLTGCSSDKWAGIKVAGGNPDFDIEVKNEAIIENTSQAAITMWPTDSSDPGNGIAKIENSTFNNVRGVVGFFARNSSINPSYVKNCTVNNSRWGISNTNCHNIEVSGNTFNEIELECIFGSMGSYYIYDDNTFRSGQQDILFMNTSPTLSSVIENNRFYGRNTGYHADGSVFAQNRIEFNQFFNGEIDILNDGHNSFRAWSNQLHAELGGVSFSNGNTVGEYGFNTFNFNFIAQLPVGTNPGFNFYENCYNSSFTDVFIDGNVASIVQQGFGDAANNCFTHQGNNSVINDLGGNPDPFIYVEPDDNDIDGRDAINAHVNVNLDETGSPVAIPECFDPFTTPPTVAFSPCNPKEGAEEAARQWLLNKISEIKSNTNLSESQKNKLLSIYRNCLKKVIGIITEIHIELEEFDDARSMYQPELSDDDKVMVYGLYIIEGDLISASTYINSISSESEQLMDFKVTQLSNLQRIKSNYIYEPSTSELASIKMIAKKDHPYAAYAKALYYAYTGEVLVSPLPVFVLNELENRSQKSIMNNKAVSINPNPFRDQLNVTLVGLDNPIIRVYNIMGKHQYSIDDNITTTINTSTWNEGIYVVQVLDGNELIKTQKVVLVK